MSKSAELTMTWTTEVLDGGRMVLVRVSMSPEFVQAEVRRALNRISTSAPPRGFRAGHVPESVLRRIHGKGVLESVRRDLLAKTREAAAKAAGEKHGFDPKVMSAPKNVVFSEEKGLFYEAVVTGLALTGQTSDASAGAVVNLGRK